MNTILTELKERFRPALASLVEDPAPWLELIKVAQNAQFGDYQANFAMPLAAKLQKSSREIAEQVVSQLTIDDLTHTPEVAGPGFINLRLRDEWLVQRLAASSADERLGVPQTSAPQTFVVDFSSPNVAKPMHVGHIRSTVIGDALCRCLRFARHHVISDNHLGDWGTQFGMILYGFRHFVDAAAYAEATVEELGRLYRLVRQIIDVQEDLRFLPQLKETIQAREAQLATTKEGLSHVGDADRKKLNKEIAKSENDLQELRSDLKKRSERVAAARADHAFTRLVVAHPELEQAVLAETARLHQGDRQALFRWQEFLPACRQVIREVYERLNVSFDHELGESFYHHQLAAVVDDLRHADLLTTSEGAACVFLDGFDAPMIVQKKDGAYLYATTDLATIKYRIEQWHPDVILYVVDARQSFHFQQLFAVAKLWLAKPVELVHVSFGTVLGDDGTPFKTRAGDTVGLTGLLDEAEQRALAVVSENDDQLPTGPRLSADDRRRIARVVGIAAVKYADLSQNRSSDYVFSYDKMLALNGNTAAYMQYSYARAHGIFEKGNIDLASLRERAPRIMLHHEAERALGLQLVRFADSIAEVLHDYRPNHLTNYLFDLARCYSTFFEQCPVLKCDSDECRDSRLLLCDLTARTIQQGLELLGIEVVSRM